MLVVSSNSEASPPFRAGLPGKENGLFCIAPLDNTHPGGACGQHAGQKGTEICVLIHQTTPVPKVHLFQLIS
jgi:hypothetical protein